jgi:FkbM family methyltransferase
MNKFYSQAGEDFILDVLFDSKTRGYFVEVGCLDGIEFSNTYHFEKKGWKGICVEAHNGFIDKLTINRPGSKVVHCAVGERNEDGVIFYANKIGSLSTVDKSEEERWKKDYSDFFSGFEEQRVSMKTLTKIFDDADSREIDFISLDIEGYEVKALEGLDLEKYKPRLFVIEYKNNEHQKQLEEILFNHKYFLLIKIGCNLIYSNNKSDEKKINKNFKNIILSSINEQGEECISTLNIYNDKWTVLIKRIRNKLLFIIKLILNRNNQKK